MCVQLYNTYPSHARSWQGINIRKVNPSFEQLQMGALPQKIRKIVNIIILQCMSKKNHIQKNKLENSKYTKICFKEQYKLLLSFNNLIIQLVPTLQFRKCCWPILLYFMSSRLANWGAFKYNTSHTSDVTPVPIQTAIHAQPGLPATMQCIVGRGLTAKPRWKWT